MKPCYNTHFLLCQFRWVYIPTRITVKAQRQIYSDSVHATCLFNLASVHTMNCSAFQGLHWSKHIIIITNHFNSNRHSLPFGLVTCVPSSSLSLSSIYTLYTHFNKYKKKFIAPLWAYRPSQSTHTPTLSLSLSLCPPGISTKFWPMDKATILFLIFSNTLSHTNQSHKVCLYFFASKHPSLMLKAWLLAIKT